MSETAAAEPKRYGTFLGVFTPTVLTVLGVIMYLRLGWVVGNAGLGGALLIIVISNTITLITALSMSTLATNMRVGVGGAYFLISRSFGLEVGGAIGIPLYLSQVLSLTLYAYGLAESLRVVFPDMGSATVMAIAAAIVVGVGAVAARSTELALKVQIPIMVLIGASILSLVAGIDWGTQHVVGLGPWTEASFWEVFAVFFPAVTGILTGLSLSGDLEDPGRSIPRGGLLAVLTGAVIYLGLPFVLANGASAADLRAEPLIWTRIAAASWLVMPGMWGAVLSSAFGSILSAPRTLQALANDRLVPGRFGEVDRATGEPLFGLRVSGGLALLAVLLGDLNAVASWVTVFFLTTYGALNAVACLESLIGDPSFRPRIRVPWWVSLLGAVGCFVAMFAINPLACVVALVVEGAIFYGLSRRSLTATWGDARTGLLLTGARQALMRLRGARFEPRNWRPHILVFTEDLGRDIPIVRVADLLGQHRGIVTLVQLLVGDEAQHDEAERILARNERLLVESDVDAFSEVTIVPDADRGALVVAQANGIAGLQSNSVLFGLHRGVGEVDELARLLGLTRQLARLEKCTLIYRSPLEESGREPRERTILVWWAGRQDNGDLMLLLAHLLTVTREWRGARIVLASVVSSEEERLDRRRELERMVPEIRIDVDIEVLQSEPEQELRDVLRERSQGADLVLLGLGIPGPGEELAYAERLAGLLDGMPATLLVHNAGPFRGRLV